MKPQQREKNQTIRTTKMGRHYIMRKIVRIEETSIGFKCFLECGHYERKYPHPSLAINMFLLSQPELKDKAKFGCFECGEKLWKERNRKGEQTR